MELLGRKKMIIPMGWCTLLSNTPLREVIDSSPVSDKIVYMVNIFPHYQKLLPQDMFEA